MAIDLALIGGTGLYRFPGLEDVSEHATTTPWGDPSDAIVSGRLGSRRVAFLARHGRGHDILPHKVNYRANLQALKDLGASRVIGINAVGGIREDMGPRALVVPDQIIDYTHGRVTSYCDVEGGEVRHVDFSEPYTQSLRQDLVDAASRAGSAVVNGGCYGATQGPRLETRAEIERMRRDGCDLVGMTGMPEAVLARELGLDYACLALVANWAAGCGDEDEISLEEIFANLEQATARVPAIVSAMFF
jgi:5'-methylthioinosine phosphorylase